MQLYPYSVPYKVMYYFAVALLLSTVFLNGYADTPFELQADSFTSTNEGNTIQAQGNIVITHPDALITADNLTYTVDEDILVATGNVIFKPTGEDLALTLKSLTLTDNLKQGTLEKLAIYTPELGQILTASQGVTKADDNANDYILEDITYSPCPHCADDKQPWRVKASEVTLHEADKRMSYKHARLEAFNIPIIYMPYFSHPIGTEDPQSGWLYPTFGSSTNRGEEITLSYFHTLKNHETDYTLRTRLMTERGAQFIGQRRHSGLTSDSEINLSVINDDRRSSVRSHAEVKGEKIFTPGTRMGVNAEIASDQAYLDDFFNRTDAYLSQTLYAEDASHNHFIGANITRYQDLVSESDPGQTIQVYPQARAERVFQFDAGDQIKLETDIINIHRDEGFRTRRLVSAASYIKPYNLDSGDRISFSASVRGDIYNVENTQNNAFNQDNARFIPQAAVRWERPLVSAGGTHRITPQAKLIVAPRGNNPEDIPNEDSTNYELNVANLFETNRFTGYDRVENGPRLVLGLDNQFGSPYQTRWRFFLGQSYRFTEDNTLPTLGGTATRASDFVGLAEATPNEWLTFSNKFRLDNSNLAPRRMDTSLLIGDNQKSYFNITHTYLDQGPEEIFADARYTFSPRWRTEGKIRQDLNEHKLLEGEIAAIFTHTCYELEFMMRRRGFENEDVQPSTDYLVNVKLLTLGATD